MRRFRLGGGALRLRALLSARTYLVNADHAWSGCGSLLSSFGGHYVFELAGCEDMFAARPSRWRPVVVSF